MNSSIKSITLYNNTRPAVMLDVRFRHKKFRIWGRKKFVVPLGFLTQNSYYSATSLFPRFCQSCQRT